jgi:hypothetical protein
MGRRSRHPVHLLVHTPIPLYHAAKRNTVFKERIMAAKARLLDSVLLK